MPVAWSNLNWRQLHTGLKFCQIQPPTPRAGPTPRKYRLCVDLTDHPNYAVDDEVLPRREAGDPVRVDLEATARNECDGDDGRIRDPRRGDVGVHIEAVSWYGFGQAMNMYFLPRGARISP